MAIHYTMTVEGGTLRVTTSGFDESLQEVEAYGLAVISAAAADPAVVDVLCDETALEYRLGTLDTFKAAEYLAAQAPHVGRAAIVCSPRHFRDAKFFETVAVNRGLTLRAFEDLAAAERWLGEDSGAD